MRLSIRRAGLACSVSFTCLLAACSVGGSGGGSTAGLTVAITDAASDELASFVVEVSSVELRRVGGGTVGVLPAPVRVDLVTLSEVSQILNVMNVPPGIYSAATVTLDFTGSSVYLIGETTPATILDGDGVPIGGTLELPITIGNALAAVAGRHRILELDFDLDQSVMVDAGTNTVFLEPAVVTRVDRSDPKDLLVGGVLRSVDTAARRFELEMQTLNGTRIADVTVAVGGLTVYQNDGVPALGSAGLSALEAQPADTWVQLYGAIDSDAARVIALYVESGTGTYNGGSDIVEGHVVERIGGAGANATLTVLGHSNDASHSAFQFNTSFTVNTNFVDTRVVRRGALIACDTDDLNIGQRVRIFGSLSGTTLDASSATDVVRLQPTRLLGYANGPVAAGVLEMDLMRVGLRQESEFTWVDGGPTPPDPDALQVAVGGLAGSLGIVDGTAVEVRGFLPPVGDAGEDFDALSVVNRDLAPSVLLILDRPGGLTLTPTFQSSDISFAIAGSAGLGEAAVVDRGFVGATPLPTSPAPSVVPAGPFGFYMIRDRQTGAVQLYLNFAVFSDTLETLTATGADIYNFGALGQYDEPSNTMTSGLVLTAID